MTWVVAGREKHPHPERDPGLDPGEQSKDALVSVQGSGVEKTAALLREAWYYAAPGRQLGRGKLLARRMLGEPVLLGRDEAGAVFALRDICPHRGMPLSAGNFDGSAIECCYHGWRFTPDGRCTAIPSLVEGQGFDLSTIGVARYPASEVQGNIWVYFGDDPGRAPE